MHATYLLLGLPNISTSLLCKKMGLLSSSCLKFECGIQLLRISSQLDKGEKCGIWNCFPVESNGNNNPITIIDNFLSDFCAVGMHRGRASSAHGPSLYCLKSRLLCWQMLSSVAFHQLHWIHQLFRRLS